MKWCILVNNAPYIMEFLGKVCFQLLSQGDECLLVFTSRTAEYEKGELFPEGARTISKPEWCLNNYKENRTQHPKLTWRQLHANFNRRTTWLWGYEESAKLLVQDYQFFEDLFDRERPDAVLFETPSGSAAQVAHLLCQMRGIPYLGITDSRIAGRFEVFDSEYTNTQYRQTFYELQRKRISPKELRFAQRFIDDFVSQKRRPSYYAKGRVRFTLPGYVSHYARGAVSVARPLLRYVRERKKFRHVDFESEIRLHNVVRAPWRTAVSQLRIALQGSLYRAMNPRDDFYLFPLHLQPEASTSVRAMHYSDQADAIQNIAFSLPFPAKLYVKEHGSALGTKPTSFYRKIQNIPNVVLIAAQESMPQLIDQCKGLITLTGTAGMEAALKGKRVYVLGNAFYEYHPLCRKAKNFDELREHILKDQEKGIAQKDLDKQNIRFIVSYWRGTLPGSVVAAAAGQDTNEYPKIASALRSVAKERKKTSKREKNMV